MSHAVCDPAAKRSGQRRGGEVDTDTSAPFSAWVHNSGEVGCARDESRLEDAKKEANRIHATRRAGDGLQCGKDTPDDHCPTEVQAWSDVPHTNVGEEISNACPNKEHANRQTELSSAESKVFFDVHEYSVTECAPIEPCKDVKHKQEWWQTKIDLAANTCFLFWMSQADRDCSCGRPSPLYQALSPGGWRSAL